MGNKQDRVTMARLHNELITCIEKSSREEYEFLAPKQFRTEDLPYMVYDSLSTANYLFDGLSDGRPTKPRFKLTHKMLNYLANGHSADLTENNIDSIACPQAELYFARGLVWHEQQQGQITRLNNKSPAAILYDIHDEPFAYQKAYGKPTAYCFRKGMLDTAAGLRAFTRDSIIELDWGALKRKPFRREQAGKDPNDIRHLYKGLGIISLRSVQPKEARFVRFAAAVLPGNLRAYPGKYAIYLNPKLTENLKDGTKLDAAMIGRQVARLLSMATQV